eukprot:CAMPEP_0194027410 /NCGR_PEP_ID=MMETSP0009_2-20130614/1562_1 /TAXON_ID=210454 /ORGANISM="Grammatophora oceanica, Strain CCMP 410" /LENGTH=403 /DNA_ID=CAMNT_0038666465 /DNA_START=110 /DNA_END=1321 /DNA_ORIENTATION=-
MPAEQQVAPSTQSSSYQSMLANQQHLLTQLKNQMALENLGGIRSDGSLVGQASNYNVVTPTTSFVIHHQPPARPHRSSMFGSTTTNEWNQQVPVVRGGNNLSTVETAAESLRSDHQSIISKRSSLGIGNDHFVLPDDFASASGGKSACCNSDFYHNKSTTESPSPAQISYSDGSFADDFEDTIGQKLLDEDEHDVETAAAVVSRATLLELSALLQNRERTQDAASIATIEDFEETEDSDHEEDGVPQFQSLAQGMVDHVMPDEACFSSDDEEETSEGEEETGYGVYACAIDTRTTTFRRDAESCLLQLPQQVVAQELTSGTMTSSNALRAAIEADPAKCKAQLEDFDSSMEKSQKSQLAIHDWDRKMGLKRSHSKTMRLSSRSRKKLRLAMKEAIDDKTIWER